MEDALMTPQTRLKMQRHFSPIAGSQSSEVSLLQDWPQLIRDASSSHALFLKEVKLYHYLYRGIKAWFLGPTKQHCEGPSQVFLEAIRSPISFSAQSHFLPFPRMSSSWECSPNNFQYTNLYLRTSFPRNSTSNTYYNWLFEFQCWIY